MDDSPRVGTRLDLIVRFHVDEIQQLTGTATGGTYRLRLGAKWTQDLPHDATSQDIERALTALPDISHHGVLCWGGPLNTTPVAVRFTGPAGKRSQPDLIVDASDLAGGTVTITTLQDGGPVELDTTPTITIKPPKDAKATLAVEALGGGTYQATYIPAKGGVHTWAATGTSTTHGAVEAEDTITVLPRTIT